MAYLTGLGTIIGLELRQRVRGVAWYVLLGVFAVLVAIVTLLLWASISYTEVGGGYLFSTIIFFVLLLGTLVAPALSGNAINGDRDAGTLATTQVTLVTTGQLVLGKFLASWITALAFLAVSLPFLGFAVALGQISFGTIVSSVLVLALELGVVAAVGIGLSGVLTRPLFSVVVTYLTVAALSIGTLIVFVLGGVATQSEARNTFIGAQYGTATDPDSVTCLDPTVSTYSIPRFDYYWGVLAANPYLVLADAASGSFDRTGQPIDLFSTIATGARQAQLPPDLDVVYDDCAAVKSNGFEGGASTDFPTPEEIYAKTVPTWFVGLTIHVLLGATALIWAWSRNRTPTSRLARGSRIA